MQASNKNLPAGFAKRLERFLQLIEEETEQGVVIMLCIYDDMGELLTSEWVFQALQKTQQAMQRLASKTGFYYYAWLDYQAGQIRVSITDNADIQQNFGSTIEYVKAIEDLVRPLYQESNGEETFDADNWITKVCVACKK